MSRKSVSLLKRRYEVVTAKALVHVPRNVKGDLGIQAVCRALLLEIPDAADSYAKIVTEIRITEVSQELVGFKRPRNDPEKTELSNRILNICGPFDKVAGGQFTDRFVENWLFDSMAGGHMIMVMALLDIVGVDLEESGRARLLNEAAQNFHSSNRHSKKRQEVRQSADWVKADDKALLERARAYVRYRHIHGGEICAFMNSARSDSGGDVRYWKRTFSIFNHLLGTSGKPGRPPIRNQ